MSTLEVNTVKPISGSSTITLGESGDTVILTTGAKTSGFGKIGQVVQTVKTDTFSTTSESFTDLTGMALSITPSSATSKILIKTSLSWGGSKNVYGHGKFVRGSTDIFMADSGGGNRISSTFPMEHYNTDSAIFNCFVASSEFLDSPSTTSVTTYKIQVLSNDSSRTLYINRPENDNNQSYIGRFTSSLTAMEILD